jgi:hypothetical protein
VWYVKVRYALELHVLLCDTYEKYGSARKCRQKFRRKFRDERVPSRQTIHNLGNKLRTTGLLRYKKQKHKRRVLNWVDDLGARLERTPRKSLNRLPQDTGVSKSSATTATQFLKLRPYKTAVIHASQPRDPAVGFYSLSSKVRSIRIWHSFLLKRGFTCRDI